MGLILRILVAIGMSACGGSGVFSGGTAVDVELDVSSVRIAEEINGSLALPTNTTGTMCIVYTDSRCGTRQAINGLWYVAEPGYFSSGEPPMNVPDIFKPTLSIYNSGTAENYRSLCKDFVVDSSGKMAFFVRMTSSGPELSNSATFKMHAEAKRCAGPVRIDNIRLVAVTRNDPTKFYTTTNPIVTESCTSDHGDSILCPIYTSSSSNLNFKSFQFQSTWPYSKQWMSGGLNWFGK